jgi:plastocyanin
MRRTRILALVALATLALQGCGSSNSPTYGGGNTGGTPPAFDSGTVTAPAQFVHTFATAGAIGYHCNFHRSMGMVGTVTVVAGAADSAVVTASGMSFAPTAVSIKPGGYVHWKVTGGTHTVTAD